MLLLFAYFSLSRDSKTRPRGKVNSSSIYFNHFFFIIRRNRPWMDCMRMGNFSHLPIITKHIIEQRFRTMPQTRKNCEGRRWRVSSLLQMWISCDEIALRQAFWACSWQLESQEVPGCKSELLQSQRAYSESEHNNRIAQDRSRSACYQMTWSHLPK